MARKQVFPIGSRVMFPIHSAAYGTVTAFNPTTGYYDIQREDVRAIIVLPSVTLVSWNVKPEVPSGG